MNGLGIFKNINNPRVFWIGILHNKNLLYLKKEIDRILNEFGFEPDNKDFKPHLTIGRIKYLSDKEKVKTIMKNYENFSFGHVQISDFIFYESILTSSGHIYKEISMFKLK